ncbi:MAG: ABC-type transport auxiliary lipoprotein family protein [Dokdonella sp.]|uniref:ABC-type transport auxiliary lipoprotein family protein n=1 Tax=Dokdonella sp. TaxID=2291710 RepID=UPI003F7CE9EB
MNARLRFSAWLLALPLAACSSLFNVQRTPFTIYSPKLAAPAQAAPAARVDWQLAIETPLASDALDTVRIVVMPRPGVIEVFPGARWSDSAPAMLRNLVVQAFENTQRITGVGSSASGLRADYALGIALHDFQLEIDGGTRAVIRLQARLLDYTTNRVLAAQAFSAQAPARGSDAAAAFAAFESALNQLLPELVEWTLREGEAMHAKRKD